MTDDIEILILGVTFILFLMLLLAFTSKVNNINRKVDRVFDILDKLKELDQKAIDYAIKDRIESNDGENII